MSGFARRLQRPGYNGGLYITPAIGNYHVGDTVTLTIREDSGGLAVNAVQANLVYPTAQLQFQSADSSASPFTTSLQNSGGSGSVTISLGTLGTPLVGDQLVVTVTFTVLATGSALVNFAAGTGLYTDAGSNNIAQFRRGSKLVIT